MSASSELAKRKLTEPRVDDLSLSDLHPKKTFILSALDKEMRLSFSKRIRATLPEKMHKYVPERLDKDESPHFKYEDASKSNQLCRTCSSNMNKPHLSRVRARPCSSSSARRAHRSSSKKLSRSFRRPQWSRALRIPSSPLPMPL